MKNYKFWKGKQRFFCSGRLESGPNIAYPIASLILINIPCGLSLAFPLRVNTLSIHVVIGIVRTLQLLDPGREHIPAGARERLPTEDSTARPGHDPQQSKLNK